MTEHTPPPPVAHWITRRVSYWVLLIFHGAVVWRALGLDTAAARAAIEAAMWANVALFVVYCLNRSSVLDKVTAAIGRKG